MRRDGRHVRITLGFNLKEITRCGIVCFRGELFLLEI